MRARSRGHEVSTSLTSIPTLLAKLGPPGGLMTSRHVNQLCRFVNIDNLCSQQNTTTQLSMTGDQAEAGIPFSILNELFDRELEEVLLRIFLYLDPCR